MTPVASLAIPTRNRAPFLARSLASYLAQHDKRFEIIVVDDGGDDDTRDVARRYATELDLTYIRRAHSGTAATRNAAIRAGRGEIVIFTDDDRVADPDFVADHVAAHAGPEPTIAAGALRGLFAAWSPDYAYSPADLATLLARRPDLAPRLVEASAELVSPAMLRDDLAGALATFAIPEPWYEVTLGPKRARYGANLVGFPFPWTLGIGGNVSMRRATLDAVGLHDEQFVGWGLEDTELHYRLHRAGVKTVLLDGGLNYHQVHRRGPERNVEWMRNACRLLDKHPDLAIALYIEFCRRTVTVDQAAAVLAEPRAPLLEAQFVRMVRDLLTSS